MDYKQARCINLAKRGMLALNTEFIGMGELRADAEHNRIGHLDLCGVAGIGVFYLLMKRGLDVLLAHPKADLARTAMPGLSGGGWQTALHCIQPFLEEVMKHTAGLASPGFETFQWLKPVRPEEPVTPMIKVLDSRRSKSKPDLGLVRFEFSGADSAGDTVWRADGTFFISTRNSG